MSDDPYKPLSTCAAGMLLKAAIAPDLDKAHDALSEVLERHDSTPAEVRNAAAAVCLELNAHFQERRAAVKEATGTDLPT